MAETWLNEAEVVIVGGGAIGTAIAYHLARKGKQVALLERRGLTGEASGSNMSVVTLLEQPDTFYDLARPSVDLFPGLSDELGYDIRYSQPGCLLVCPSEQALMQTAEEMRFYQERGVAVERLQTVEASRLEPALSPTFAGAFYLSLDGKVDHFRLTLAYARAAERLGARIYHHTEATGIDLEDGRVAGVRTSRGRMATRTVVNAAGAWAAAVGKLAGVYLPVAPCRGQLIVTERGPRIRHRVELVDQAAIMQTADGHLLIGSKPEYVGYDKRTDYTTPATWANRIVQYFPALAGLNVIRMWAGLRPVAPDRAPLLGWTDVPGLAVAAGHFRLGITCAPMTGQLMAELIADGKTSLSLERYSPERFRAGPKR